MKWPTGWTWLPSEWKWSALTDADRLLLMLSLSVLLHAPLFFRLALEGKPSGTGHSLTVSLQSAAPAKPDRVQPDQTKPLAPKPTAWHSHPEGLLRETLCSRLDDGEAEWRRQAALIDPCVAWRLAVENKECAHA